MQRLCELKNIIYYGNNLADYFANEFAFKLPVSFGSMGKPKKVRFWSDMVDRNNGIPY